MKRKFLIAIAIAGLLCSCAGQPSTPAPQPSGRMELNGGKVARVFAGGQVDVVFYFDPANEKELLLSLELDKRVFGPPSDCTKIEGDVSSEFFCGDLGVGIEVSGSVKISFTTYLSSSPAAMAPYLLVFKIKNKFYEEVFDPISGTVELISL